MRQTRRQFVCTSAALAAVAALGTSVAIADEKAAEAEAEAPAEFELEGPFVLGFDQDFPPYGYVGNDGEFTGFDLDMAAKVCEMEGWELVLEPIAWDAKDTLLNSGMITCIWNGFTMEGREEDYCFTAAYMENRQVVVVRADAGIADLAGLEGRVVITQADSAALGLLAEGGDQAELGATFAELQTIGEYNTAFMMLETGAVDAVALDYPVAIFQIGDRLDQFTILEEPLNSEHYGVGFAKTEQGAALAAIVEADLLALTEDGTVEELCEKYGDQGISFDAWCIGKAEAGALADGTYTGNGKGIGGTVPVTVTVEGGVITAVEVGDNAETVGIGSKAIEKLPALIVEANGVEGVDGVSGATITSKAIFDGVAKALEGAVA